MQRGKPLRHPDPLIAWVIVGVGEIEQSQKSKPGAFLLLMPLNKKSSSFESFEELGKGGFVDFTLPDNVIGFWFPFINDAYKLARPLTRLLGCSASVSVTSGLPPTQPMWAAQCPVSASLPHLFSLSGGSPLMNRKVRALIKLLAEMNLSDVLMHF